MSAYFGVIFYYDFYSMRSETVKMLYRHSDLKKMNIYLGTWDQDEMFLANIF